MYPFYKQLTKLKQKAQEISKEKSEFNAVALIPPGETVGLICICKDSVNFQFFINQWVSDARGRIFNQCISEEHAVFVLFGMNLENIDDHLRKWENSRV